MIEMGVAILMRRDVKKICMCNYKGWDSHTISPLKCNGDDGVTSFPFSIDISDALIEELKNTFK